ncbi:magnesium/cobalt transporter CorA [Falsarthrobacter nasiphocae]|uniref:Magnesium transport protein CorA n=1 Tax=Falsarthrobacter nasiphocae TaxID=189863 RepID=A0AAE3YE38_9MICC|nr:magnesium/cobalt transporter CorA [Falsarthrobacter nasiphocae]MDR6892173.1 magnesium transporter [Falsarthrobacter nasiphocae]
MAIIDNAVYVDGRRVATPASLDVTFDLLREHSGMAWIGMYRPSEEEIRAVAREFDLHELAVEDAMSGHQRSKLEQYGDTLFAVLRPARYIDADERVEFGELHVFAGPNFVVTIRHAERPSLTPVRERLEEDPEMLSLGPDAVLYATLDEVVDEYEPVVAGLENDIDEIETELFAAADDDALSRRIYQLSREVIQFQRATAPLTGMLEGLLRHIRDVKGEVELQRHLRDVHDHAIRLSERVNSFRSILDNALTVHSTLVTQRMTEQSITQNDQVKKISSWAAIFFAPQLVAGIYGMNFDEMPELHWAFGYPFAVLLMVVFAALLWGIFRLKKWL